MNDVARRRPGMVSRVDPGQSARRGAAVVLMTAFFAVATLVAALSAVTLLWPGTSLDGIWAAKPEEHEALAAYGPGVGLGFAALAVLLGVAAAGWWRRRRWGWLTGTLVVGANVASDAVRLIFAPAAETALPVVLAGALLAWLLSPGCRRRFAG